jgi:hypothetical protein
MLTEARPSDDGALDAGTVSDRPREPEQREVERPQSPNPTRCSDESVVT